MVLITPGKKRIFVKCRGAESEPNKFFSEFWNQIILEPENQKFTTVRVDAVKKRMNSATLKYLKKVFVIMFCHRKKKYQN